MRWGMPYKGSKNAIAEKLINAMPDAEYFVDLFGGGGAMSHCAALSHKYKKVIYNELEPLVYKGFTMAIHGEYSKEKRWISREDFHKLKTVDPYAALCFSFGNTMKNYAYSKEIEPWKRALHYARVLGDNSQLRAFGIASDGSRADIKAHKEEYKKQYIAWYMKNIMKTDKVYQLEKAQLEKNIKEESEKLRAYLIKARDGAELRSCDVDKHLGTNGMSGHYFGKSQWEFPTKENYEKMQEIMPLLDNDYEEIIGLSSLWQSLQSLQSLESLERLESLQSLESLERLERLESLERLERLERLETYNLSYEQVKIPKNSVVYCDIPYKDTDKYISEFDHDAFYKWALSQPFEVYISEYDMPLPFYPVYEWDKRSTLGTGNKTKTVEKLFCNRKPKMEVYKQLELCMERA